MIASNIICRGVSRFLNTIYCQDIQVSGTASLSSLSLSGNLSVTGTSTLTGNTTVGGTLGVTGGATFSGHVTINGSTHFRAVELYDTTPYIDFHYNNSTADYTSRIIESSSGTLHIAQNLTIASTISAPTGIIPTFNSTNVNVTNNLRANHYDLQTVAQLGGSFYVSPTVKFPNSGTTLKVEKSGSTLTLTITDSSITSATMAGVVWTAGSGVKVSGTINGVVTGTMDGTVSSINTSSHTLTLSVSGENSGNVQASPSGSPYNASQFKDLSVMLYTRKQDGTSKMINTASGVIASFTDGGNNVPVKQLVVDIEPVQDLHGYDAPWVGGAGKNKFKMRSVSQSSNGITVTANSDGTVSLSGTATANAQITMYDNADILTSLIAEGGTFTMSLNKGTYNGNTLNVSISYKETASGSAKYIIPNNPVTIPQGSIFNTANLWVPSGSTVQTLTHFSIQLEKGSSATTFAPYENICPISGHTQAVVTRTGKNLLNYDAWRNGVTLVRGTAVFENNGITFTATGTDAYTGYNASDYPEAARVPVTAGETVTLSWETEETSRMGSVYMFNSAGTFVWAYSEVGTLSYTVASGITYVVFRLGVTTAGTTAHYKNIMIRRSGDATWQPYHNDISTIDLGGTRYGGQLDVTSGLMNVTHAFYTINGQYSVNKHGVGSVDGYYIYLSANGLPKCASTKDGTVGMFNMFKIGALSDENGCGFVGSDTIQFRIDGGGSGANVKTWLANNPLQVCYPLAEPFTVQLPRTEVRTLLGYNNIWSNTGDTNLIYESSQIDSTSNYNVGIWMNCYDQANSSSTIRVYNGSSRWPNVFLGNMTNADLPRVNGNAPYGYGLYSDNVFLRGIISATGGLIGNWTIGTTGMYYDTDVPSSTSITMIPGGTTASTTSIGGSSGSKSWVFTVKNLFGVDTSGALYSTSGKIGGWDIGTDRFSSHSTNPYVLLAPGVGTNNDVFYVRTGSGTTADPYKWPIVMRANGYFYADNATISGKITATSGYFGGSDGTNGWEISTGKIQSTYTYSNATKYMGIGTYNHSWAFYSGASTNGGSDGVFKVGHGGEMYATNAHITGEVTAQSGIIGGFHITSSSNQGTSSAGGHIYPNSLYRHSGDGTTYEYEFGIKGDAAENPSSSNSEYGNLAFYVKRINKGAAWNGTNTNMFYVTHKGFMYCREAEITGKITATSGAIAGWRIESTYLASGTATAPAANTLLLSPAGTSSSYTVAGTAKSGWMITAGTTFGVNKDGGVYATSGAIGPWHVTTTSIYKAANTLGSTTSGAAYFGDLGLSVGNKFKVDASGDGAIILGELAEGKTHIEVDNDSFDICSGATTGDNAVKLATFGEVTRIGNGGSNNVLIDAGGFSFTNTDGDEMMKISTDNVVIGKDGSSYFYVDSNSIVLKDNENADVFKVESGGGNTITNSDYARYTHKFTNTQVQNGVSIRVNHSNIKSAPTNITVAFWKRYAYTVIVNGETKTLYEDRIFSRVALGSRYYTSTYVENEYGKININSDGVTQINSWIDHRYNSGETIKFDIMFNYTWQSNTYSNLNMNGNMVVTDSIASDEMVATTSVTSGDFVFGANGMSINEMQQASAAPTITSSNKIDSTPAIGAQLTLYSGVYLLVANGNFNSGSSSGQRINQIAIYTGINPTNANIITSSRVRVVNAGSYWSSLSTQIIVTVPSNTGQTFTVGLTSSIAQSAASSTLLQAVFLRPPSS